MAPTRKRRLLATMALSVAVVAAVALPAPSPSYGQSPLVSKAIDFDGPSAVVKDRVVGKDIRSYTFQGRAGQATEISLEAVTPSANFNLLRFGDAAAIFAGARDGRAFVGDLPEDGTYEIRVFLMGQAAETGSADFTLTVSLPGRAEPSGDFADGMMGGPDFWGVAGMDAGGRLNVRASPTTSSAILQQLGNGTVLRNLGCRESNGEKWCQVEPPDGGYRGWVAGRYLREAALPTDSDGDALVPGTNYHATGSLPCAIEADLSAKSCEFGVTRGEPGIATVFITIPNGFVRVIKFSSGEVSPMSGVRSFKFERVGDETLVTIDEGAETYRVPDAVILGG